MPNMFSTLPEACQADCKQAMKKVFALVKGDQPDNPNLVINILDNLNLNEHYMRYVSAPEDSDSDSRNSNFVDQYGLLHQFTVDGKTILDIVLEKKQYSFAKMLYRYDGVGCHFLRKLHKQVYLKEAAAAGELFIVVKILQFATKSEILDCVDQAIADQNTYLLSIPIRNKLLKKGWVVDGQIWERLQQADKLNSTELYYTLFIEIASQQQKLWALVSGEEINITYKKNLINDVLATGANPLAEDEYGDIPLVDALEKKKTAIVNAILSSRHFVSSCRPSWYQQRVATSNALSEFKEKEFNELVSNTFLKNFSKVVIAAATASNVEALYQLGDFLKSLNDKHLSPHMNSFRMSLTAAAANAITKHEFSVVQALFLAFKLDADAEVSDNSDDYTTLFSLAIEQDCPAFRGVENFFDATNIRRAWTFALNAKPLQYKVIDLILETRSHSLIQEDFTHAINVLQHAENFSFEKLLIKAPEAVIRQALYAAINKMTSEDIQERKRTVDFIAKLLKFRKESCDKSHVEFSKEVIIFAIDHGHSELAAWMISPKATWETLLLITLKNKQYEIATALCRKGATLLANSEVRQNLLSAVTGANLGDTALLIAGNIIDNENFEFTDDTVVTLEVTMRTRQHMLAILIQSQFNNTNLSAGAQKSFEDISSRLAANDLGEDVDVITKPNEMDSGSSNDDNASDSAVESLDMLKSFFKNMRTEDERVNKATSTHRELLKL